jgi:hypothetical protein
LRGKTRNARKSNIAARHTTAKGESTFVETTVAIEFAESWNPLMKSKISTRPIIIYR